MVLVKNADSQAYPRPTVSLDVGPRGRSGLASFMQHTSTQTGLSGPFPTGFPLAETSLFARVGQHSSYHLS